MTPLFQDGTNGGRVYGPKRRLRHHYSGLREEVEYRDLGLKTDQSYLRVSVNVEIIESI